MKSALPSVLLLAPIMPTFSTLVKREQHELGTPAASTRTSNELFTALVGDPRKLYFEVLEDPSRFEDGVMELATGLMRKTRTPESLTRTEKDLLNRATLDWARPRHQPSGGEVAESLPQRSDALDHLQNGDESDELEQYDDGSVGPVNDAPPIPVEAPPTFWWRNP